MRISESNISSCGPVTVVALSQQSPSLVRASVETTMSQECGRRKITTSRGFRWALACTTIMVGVAVQTIYYEEAAIRQAGNLQDAIVRVKRGMSASEAVEIVGEAPHSIATQQAVVLSDHLTYVSPQSDQGDSKAPEMLTFMTWEHGRVTIGVVTDSSERVVNWTQHFRQPAPTRFKLLHWLEECLERVL